MQVHECINLITFLLFSLGLYFYCITFVNSIAVKNTHIKTLGKKLIYYKSERQNIKMNKQKLTLMMATLSTFETSGQFLSA
jgi:hypothetical protein